MLIIDFQDPYPSLHFYCIFLEQGFPLFDLKAKYTMTLGVDEILVNTPEFLKHPICFILIQFYLLIMADLF